MSDSIPPPPIGRHLIADLFGVAPALLEDERGLMRLFCDALKSAGFHQLGEQCHKFPDPGGVTGIVLLSESHASFHSYPEHGYLALDVFSCGMADPAPVLATLAAELCPGRVQQQLIDRGRTG